MNTIIEHGVRCGNHGQERVYHASASEVRTCYQGARENLIRSFDRWSCSHLPPQDTIPLRMATEKMQAYATDLRNGRHGGEAYANYPVQLTFDQAETIIENLFMAPKKVAPSPALSQTVPTTWRKLAEQVPNGRYAVRYNGDKAHFYRVTRTAKGYLKVQEQASDSWFEKRYVEYAKIFEAIIGTGVEESGRMYASLLGQCRRCGRLLTDEHNPYKAVGYGPDCGAKA